MALRPKAASKTVSRSENAAIAVTVDDLTVWSSPVDVSAAVLDTLPFSSDLRNASSLKFPTAFAGGLSPRIS